MAASRRRSRPRATAKPSASPQVLPGGGAILFTSLPSTGAVRWDTAQIVVQSIGSDDRTVVWRGGRDARYVPTGHLLYAQGTTLFGVPFDIGRRAVTGSQTPMVEGLRAFPGPANTDTAQYAVSDAGVLVYLTGGAPPIAITSSGGSAPRSLAWVSRTGQETPLRVRADDYTIVRISPDGTKTAIVVGNALGTDRPTDIWIYDLAAENLRQLTFDAKDDDGPVWTSRSDRLDLPVVPGRGRDAQRRVRGASRRRHARAPVDVARFSLRAAVVDFSGRPDAGVGEREDPNGDRYRNARYGRQGHVRSPS